MRTGTSGPRYGGVGLLPRRTLNVSRAILLFQSALEMKTSTTTIMMIMHCAKQAYGCDEQSHRNAFPSTAKITKLKCKINKLLPVLRTTSTGCTVLCLYDRRLQAVMNAAARLVFQSSRHDHITPRCFAVCTGFVRQNERITYKLAIIAYQCLRGLTPAYLADALQSVAQSMVDNDCVHLRPQHWLYHQHRSVRLVTELSRYSRSENLEQSTVGSDVI